MNTYYFNSHAQSVLAEMIHKFLILPLETNIYKVIKTLSHKGFIELHSGKRYNITLLELPNEDVIGKVYTYKDHDYKIIGESQVKVGTIWQPCIIYKCLYDNPDGLVWIRPTKMFFELFKAKQNGTDSSLQIQS